MEVNNARNFNFIPVLLSKTALNLQWLTKNKLPLAWSCERKKEVTFVRNEKKNKEDKIF